MDSNSSFEGYIYNLYWICICHYCYLHSNYKDCESDRIQKQYLCQTTQSKRTQWFWFVIGNLTLSLLFVWTCDQNFHPVFQAFTSLYSQRPVRLPSAQCCPLAPVFPASIVELSLNCLTHRNRELENKTRESICKGNRRQAWTEEEASCLDRGKARTCDLELKEKFAQKWKFIIYSPECR